MSDYNWPEEVAYVNAVDFSADQRLAEYHPRAVTANGKSAYRQKIQLLGNDKLKILLIQMSSAGKVGPIWPLKFLISQSFRLPLPSPTPWNAKKFPSVI